MVVERLALYGKSVHVKQLYSAIDVTGGNELSTEGCVEGVDIFLILGLRLSVYGYVIITRDTRELHGVLAGVELRLVEWVKAHLPRVKLLGISLGLAFV